MDRLKPNQIIYIPESDPVILYKKLSSNMKSPYQLFKYIIRKIYFVKKFNEDIYKQCVKNRIYSVPKDQLTKWLGIRFFEVHVWGKCILESGNKVGSEYLKIIRELEPEEFIKYMNSNEAYLYCRLVKDIKEIRNKINNSFAAYAYCKYIKDRKEIRNKINDSYYAYCYCKDVKDRKDMRNKIVVSYWAYYYCINVKNRKEIKDRIVDSKLIETIDSKLIEIKNA